MAHTCPYCGMLCHCKGDIDDIDMGYLPRGGCMHYVNSGCDSFDNDPDLDDWGEDDIDDFYDPNDEDMNDPTAHDPMAEKGIVEQPKNLEDE
jgi:hypothetical protein